MSEFLVIALEGQDHILAIHGCPDMKSVRDISEFFSFKFSDHDYAIYVYRLLEV